MSDSWNKRGKAYQPSSQSSYRYYPNKFARRAPVVSTAISTAPAPPLGKLIRTLYEHDLDQDAKPHMGKASIQDCSLAASYNWLDKSSPAILIPGIPPRWTPLVGETKLPQDSGDYFRDKNAAKYPAHLMESTVLAALSLDPHASANIDIVACYSSLGNLLRFILGRDKSFRVLVQVIGNAVFFVRRENSLTEMIEGIKGHGHTFPEAYTAWDREAKGSDTSHRILKYRFGGLNMLVRAEADGYLAPKRHGDSTPLSPRTRPAAAAPVPVTDAEVESMLEVIQNFSMTTTATSTINSPTPTSPAPKIDVIRSDAIPSVAQDRILEIKTRGHWKKDKEDTADEEMPKLWLGRVRHLVVAYHIQGTFRLGPELMALQDVGGRVDAWERGAAAPHLARFAALLHQIVSVARARPDGKIELCRIGTGPLHVREQCADAGEMLSEEMKERWEEGRKQTAWPVDPFAQEEKLQDELGVDDGEWDDEKDWAECGEACGYCGRCGKK